LSLRRFNPRRDANEGEIIDTLEKLGFNVSTVSSTGIPDLLVSRRELFHLAEVKMPGGRTQKAQDDFRAKHSGTIWRLECPADCVSLSNKVP